MTIFIFESEKIIKLAKLKIYSSSFIDLDVIIIFYNFLKNL